MKKLNVLVLVLLMAAFIVPSVSAKDVGKIGYVNLSTLFDSYYKTKDYDKELEGKFKGFEDERNQKIEKIRESQGKLGLLKEDKKAELEGEIETMKADLLEYDRQKKADISKERNEKIREILLEIEGIVRDYAEKNKFDIILNDRVLIYGSDVHDLTQKVLEKLNTKQPK